MIRLHGKAHEGIDGANAACLELDDDRGADMVDLVSGPVELEIGNGPGGTAHRLARHAHDEAHQRLGPGIIAKELVALRVEPRAVDLDETGIVGATFERELA